MTRPHKLIAAIGFALFIVSACMSDAGGISAGQAAAGVAAGSGCLITARMGGGQRDTK